MCLQFNSKWSLKKWRQKFWHSTILCITPADIHNISNMDHYIMSCLSIKAYLCWALSVCITFGLVRDSDPGCPDKHLKLWGEGVQVMRMAVHIEESRLVTFPLFRPHWQPQEILRPVKGESTAERSLSWTSPVGWDPRDASSVATCVVETTSWAQASICMYTRQSILGNYCGQDGWQHVYMSTYILSFFPTYAGTSASQSR